MARMYSRKHGRHGSKKPPVKMVPKWVSISKEEIEGIVVSLAKERKNSAVIGTVLRDQYGIPDVKLVVGKSVAQIMKANQQYPEFPEDLLSLFRKAVELRAHLSLNKKDKNAIKGLENLESKIRRLVKYYSEERKIPDGFEYDPEKAKLIIQK